MESAGAVVNGFASAWEGIAGALSSAWEGLVDGSPVALGILFGLLVAVGSLGVLWLLAIGGDWGSVGRHCRDIDGTRDDSRDWLG